MNNLKLSQGQAHLEICGDKVFLNFDSYAVFSEWVGYVENGEIVIPQRPPMGADELTHKARFVAKMILSQG